MFLADFFKGINSFEYIEECLRNKQTYAEQILKQIFKEEKEVISIISEK